eukprot:TRINITY_DN3640_c0_g1_i1.p1 TRINITY_DN3640_c0_g1~~TRINITY_DN3640_c0_g1_i1.p1  ORF type:complete len:227 (-),score=40.72 TRINITY_DN3640_c0_g1_i1:195-875(-)
MPKPVGNLWNLTSCNRLVHDRLVGRQHERHCRALESARGLIDHTPPEEQAHLRAKAKKHKLQEDRAAEIQLENRILLQKMLNIDTKPSPLSAEAMNSSRVTPRTMNGLSQRRELDRITAENQALLKRLQDVQPSISTAQWYDEEIDRQALKYRLSQNAARGKQPSLRVPDKFQASASQYYTPRQGGNYGHRASDNDWTELSNAELEKHLYELETMKSSHHPSLTNA